MRIDSAASCADSTDVVRVLVLTCPGDDVELAADRLWAAGARAVEQRDRPGGDVDLVTVLAGEDATALARFGEVPTSWQLGFEDVADEPANTWREFARPVDIDGVAVIRPAWLEPVGAPIEIAIEPGASFGLGDHPTTRLCAESIVGAVRGGEHVLDVGCGSGVLAILALRRGADWAMAIDVSEAAREAAAANASRNGVADRMDVATTPVGAVHGRFDLVLANILAPTLVAIAGDLRRLTAPGGTLVVSGVLATAHDHVTEALAPMVVRGTHERDGWAAVELVHPPSRSS